MRGTKPPSRPGRRVHPVDEVLPAGTLAVHGFPHLPAFYAGAVPIRPAGAIGLDEREPIHPIDADLSTCGIASTIQSVGSRRVGAGLPLL